jgi:triosephosphate isomerase
MRNKFVAGNWKMTTKRSEGNALAGRIDAWITANNPKSEVCIAPSFPFLYELNASTSTSLIVAAQNCASKENGAYTGETSVEMLQSIDIHHVILGHSERRSYYHEDVEEVTKKVNLVSANGLIPILCVGEHLEERKSGKHFLTVKDQLSSLNNLSKDQFEKVIIAYEPVWAIGTGETATPEQAQEMHAFIRGVIREKFDELAEHTRILYGGSVKPSNALELFSQPDVDGGLVGGASLDADSFISILQAAEEA